MKTLTDDKLALSKEFDEKITNFLSQFEINSVIAGKSSYIEYNYKHDNNIIHRCTFFTLNPFFRAECYNMLNSIEYQSVDDGMNNLIKYLEVLTKFIKSLNIDNFFFVWRTFPEVEFLHETPGNDGFHIYARLGVIPYPIDDIELCLPIIKASDIMIK